MGQTGSTRSRRVERAIDRDREDGASNAVRWVRDRVYKESASETMVCFAGHVSGPRVSSWGLVEACV